MGIFNVIFDSSNCRCFVKVGSVIDIMWPCLDAASILHSSHIMTFWFCCFALKNIDLLIFLTLLRQLGGWDMFTMKCTNVNSLGTAGRRRMGNMCEASLHTRQ